ncbi:hypothetical protein HPB51_013746 [Rhipicephalus microplus]|uniref:Uncharacterized protein n=1 Tax=Rhipicephalus microplus TaxID=6941 RepID=A0A9J6F2Q5_RHIMP|nr:hypothetical protein HPB51_013746 [Rhipicephalus microplus]
MFLGDFFSYYVPFFSTFEGIGGLEEHVVRTATLSTCTACAPFADMRGPVTPILRVALEPRRLADMATLVRGLKLLHQADPCVQVLLQETGEHVLLTAGEVPPGAMPQRPH